MPIDPLEITGGIAIGEGVGGAIAAVVEPQLQNLKNKQWAAHMDVPLDARDAAAAEQQEYPGNLAGITDASYSGINGDRYLALRYLAATAPGTPELLELWRRGKIGPDLVRKGLKKAGLMDEFVDAVLELFTGRLDPAVIATAIQRGIMHDPGFLPVGPPTGSGVVPAFPVSPLDPIEEAKAHGIDADRLFVETAIVGLPLALNQAAQAYFRGEIELDDFYRAVSEGNTRNEWRDAALAVSRQILTSGEYAELELRGFVDAPTRRKLTAKHGMSAQDSDYLYNVLGRAPGIHAVTTGLARGGKYDGQPQTIPEPFLSAVQRQNIRPEWYDIEYANRYSYPSAFVLRSLATSGELGDQHAVEQILLEIGWPPSLAAKVSAEWVATATAAGATGPKLDPWVVKANNHLWTEVQKRYIGGAITQAQAQPALTLIGVTQAAQTEVFARWDEQRVIQSE